MKVWIDLSNSPHPLLFAPVARQLEELGHTVELTARDNAQTVELARQRWTTVEVVGGASPKERLGKAASIGGRIRDLVAWSRRERPDVAVSHNSYAQIVAARATGVRTVTAMDFEHQPLNHLAFRLAHQVLLPDALRTSAVRREGATPRKVRFYPGFKEEIYLGDFDPDPEVLHQIGVEVDAGGTLVVARPPPSRAIYHQFDNPLFLEALRVVGREPRATCVVLARHPEQRRLIGDLRLPNLILPARALDSRSLMRSADLVLGAGGTMTREAALMGVPTFSLFAGDRPAVDHALEQEGLLRQLQAASELLPIQRRTSVPVPLADLRARSEWLARIFASAVAAHPCGGRL